MKLRTIRAGRAQSIHCGKKHRVSIEPLESRIAPASGLDVIFSTGALTVIDSAGASSDANLTVSLNGANIRITDPNQDLNAIGGVTQIDVHTVEIALSSVTSLLQVDGGSGNDSLLIDFSGGNPIPSSGFDFDGGIGTDTLTVSGGTVSTITHAPITFDSGGLVIDGTPVIYDGLEDFTESLNATFRFFGFDNAADVITLTSGPGPLMTLSSTNSLATKFASPTNTLFFNTGGGGDSITITSVQSNFTGSLIIDGDVGTDLINIDAADVGYSINATAESIEIRSVFSVPAGGAVFNGNTLLQMGTGFSFDIGGSGFSPLFGDVQVNGVLNIQGDVTAATLDITSSLTSLPTSPIRIISNDGSDSIIGTFEGFPEGASITINGATFVITYVGGDGNDVEISAVIPTPIGVIDLGALDGSNGLIIPGRNVGDKLGYSVSSAGDVNNDGVDDFIIGASELTVFSSSAAGTAYIIFGTDGGFPSPFDLATLTGTNGFRIEGAGSDYGLGQSVSKAGDVNGDGIGDILVSAKESESSGTGATYVIFGHSGSFSAAINEFDLDGSNGFLMAGLSSNEQSEHVSSTAGDMNGDGVADILIGIRSAVNDNGARSGAAYVVFGHKTAPFPSTLNLSALNGDGGFKINGEYGTDLFGGSVSSAGDINGDGFDDILIGAPRAKYGDGGVFGAAYIIFGKRTAFPAAINAADLDGKKGFKVLGLGEFDYLGASVSTAGDVNGDGLGDIALGAPQTNSDSSGPGVGYVIFGKRTAFPANYNLATLNGANGFALLGESLGNFTGRSVSSAGDFNGDGFDDILVGAPRADDGATYLVFGRPAGFPPALSLTTLNGTTGYKFVGSVPGGEAGHSVSGAGDVNGDGKDDIIIGGPLGGGQFPNAGNAYVVFGNGAIHDLPAIKSAGKTATFTDTDGDLVSVSVNKGKITADMLTFGPDGGLFLVDLNAGNTFKDGANISFTVKKVPGGNGVINVGAIRGTGFSLGNVKVTGDLGQIDVGNGNPLKSALKSLSVGSLGLLGADMQLPGTFNPLTSDISGGLGKFTVRGNINLATINVLGKLGNITVGGDFIGTGALDLPQLQGLAALGHGVVAPVGGGTTLANSGLNAGNIGSLNVKQSLSNAAVNSSGNIGSASIGGSINKGAIVAAGSLKVVKVTGAITSDDPNQPSVIAALAAVPNGKPASAIAINAFTVKGDVLNAEILVGYNRDFIATNSDASIGTLTVKGMWTASSVAVGVADFAADGFGRNDRPIFAGADGTGIDTTPKIISRIASLIIAKVAEGSATAGDFFGITAQSIVKAKINGVKIVLDKLIKDDIAIGMTGDFHLVEL